MSPDILLLKKEGSTTHEQALLVCCAYQDVSKLFGLMDVLQ